MDSHNGTQSERRRKIAVVGTGISGLSAAWLLSRLYWQGFSTVLTRRSLGYPVWRELPRRLAVALLYAPLAAIPKASTSLLEARWRLAYAAGFLRAALRGGRA